jgi:hypothetical protein
MNNDVIDLGNQCAAISILVDRDKPRGHFRFARWIPKLRDKHGARDRVLRARISNDQVSTHRYRGAPRADGSSQELLTLEQNPKRLLGDGLVLSPPASRSSPCSPQLEGVIRWCRDPLRAAANASAR